MPPRPTVPSWLAALAVPVAVFLLVALALRSRVPAAVDLPVRDAVLRALPPRPASEVAVVAIDEEALDAEGPWPWPRARIAAVADAARRDGARGLVLDLLLAEPGPGDDLLAASLRQLPSVLAAAVDARAGWVVPAPLLAGAAQLAETSFDVDHDGVVRRLSATKQRDGVARTALPLAAALLLQPSLPVPAGRLLVPDFRCRPSGVPVVGAAALLAGRSRGALRGRVAFLGVTAAGLGDRYIAAGSVSGLPEPGVLVHAAAAACIRSGGLIRPVPPLGSALLAAALSAAVARVGQCASRRRPWLALLAVLPAAAGVPLLAAGVELPLATLTAVAAASVLAVEVLAARRGEREAARAAAEREAERADRRVAVHEMKTPLTAVRGLTQLLSGLELSPAERQRVIGMVGEETERLAGLIESLNTAERLRLQDFDRAARPLDLGALARRRVEALGAASRGRVVGRVPDGLLVRGDEAALARAVDNLVGNALKFSPEGTSVTVSAGRRGGEILLSVADEGPGIPETERALIFGRFVRGRAAPGTEGLGLGLALVHEVATWHRGRITSRANEGRGSVFELFLPLVEAQPPGKEEETVGIDPGR